MPPRKLVLLLALTPLLCAAKPVTCDPVLDGQCGSNSNATDWCPVVLAMQCPSGQGEILMSQYEAPPAEHTQVVCDYTGGGYHCEAWPKLAGVSYTWSKFGMVNWVSPPDGADYANISCTAGINNTVSVTVTSPYGLGEVSTAHVYCGASGEY